MILISNHLLQLEQFKDLKDVVVRINMAHVTDEKEFDKFIKIKHNVMVDFPKGRKKPPLPKMDLHKILKKIKSKRNIKYLAMSNTESAIEVYGIISNLPSRISFVPKIETLKGVINLNDILTNNDIKYVMVDTEDLYTDLKGDNDYYLDALRRIRSDCRMNKVKLLNLYGVVFKEEGLSKID